MNKERWRFVWVVLLGVTMLTVGCGDDDGGVRPDNGSTPSKITVPMAVGNTWIYTTETNTTAIPTTAVDTSRVVGVETIDGETYYVLENVTPEGTERALVRQAGQDILVMPAFERAKSEDPFQQWMDQITSASLPWKIADFDAASGSQWVEIDATSQFTLGGSDVGVRYEVHGASLGRGSVSAPAGDYTDAYRGEFTTRLTLRDPSGVMLSSMASRLEYSIADGVGTIKEVLASSAEMEGGGYTITKTSELSSYALQ